VKYFL